MLFSTVIVSSIYQPCFCQESHSQQRYNTFPLLCLTFQKQYLKITVTNTVKNFKHKIVK